MPLFKPKAGDRFRRNQIVSQCLAHIHSPAFNGNVAQKEKMTKVIHGMPSEWLEFRPRGAAWGRSAMNPNCWVPAADHHGSDLAAMEGIAPKVGDRVRHKENGYGRVVELKARSSGKTGRATALVHWDTHRVLDRGPHGEARTWVSQSSLTVQTDAQSAATLLSNASRQDTANAALPGFSRNEEERVPQGHESSALTGPAPDEFALPDEASAVGLIEGAVRAITVNAYERDPKARAKCIRAHGTACSVCGFSFAKAYGDIAKDYIHVHHLRPLSEVGEAHEVDPVRDLRPVCPNCHAVLHRRVPAYGIEELRAIIAKQRTA